MQVETKALTTESLKYSAESVEKQLSNKKFY